MTNDQTCWEFFRSNFRRTDGNVVAEIHTPERLGLTEGQIITGPNDDLTRPDFSVGFMMQLIDRTNPSTQIPRIFIVADLMTGQPLPDAEVTIRKQAGKQANKRYINQGRTVNRGDHIGQIRLRGAEVGDTLLTSMGS